MTQNYVVWGEILAFEFVSSEFDVQNFMNI